MAITLTSTSTTGALKVNGQDVLTTDAAGEVSLRTGGDLLTANEFIKSNLNAIGDAPIYACRAWVNFNGTGTVAIRASGNVSSITDNGTGDYTVNFTTPMPDANYALTATCRAVDSNSYVANVSQTTELTATAARVLTESQTSTPTDVPSVYVAMFR